MAEKPRLKKSNEILGSIAADSARSPRPPGASPRRYGAGQGKDRDERPQGVPSPKADALDDGSEIEESMLPSAQSLAEKLMAREDRRRKLNFDKYELPRGNQAALTPAPSPAMEINAPKTASFETEMEIAPAPPHPAPQRAAAAPAAPAPPPAFDNKPASAPVITEYTFEAFEPSPEIEAAAAEGSLAPPAPRRSVGERARRRVQPRPEAKPLVQEEETASGFIFEPAAEKAPLEPEVKKAPEPEPQAPPKAASEPSETLEQRRRKEFLDRISNQFEMQFGERFGDGLNPRDLQKPEEPPQKPRESIFERPVMRREAAFREPEPKSMPAPPPEPKNSAVDDGNTRDFLSRFMTDIEREEERRDEDFKETLADKFMRERERYLEDLGISIKEKESEPVPRDIPATAPPRRKLDFQIQPEMHLSGDDIPLHKPRQSSNITYNRGGAAVEPEADGQASGSDALNRRQSQGTVQSGKKTSEQLLMEHSRLAKMPAQPVKTKSQKPLRFTFETPEEQEKRKKTQAKKVKINDIMPKDKWPRRIVFISMVCGVFAITLLSLPLINYFKLADRLAEQSDFTLSSVPAVQEDTLDVYETKSFDNTAKVNNLMFKNADIALKNADVSNYVIIENITQEGKIRLEDVNVGAAISLKSGGVNALELHNVKAKRVILDNPDRDVTLTVSGETDIEAVEVRTPSSVRQLEIGSEAMGISGVEITSDGEMLNAKLDGLNLESLSTDISDTILAFENGTQVEAMSCDGSLSLTGTGRITSLAIGAMVGQGAGDTEEQKPVNLIVKGVNIVNLSVKSPMSVNVQAQVDSLTTSDSINLDGSGGSVASLTINPGQNPGRLVADISGISINTAYSNTEARLNIAASASVNALVANKSTFILGNKVNHLIANADEIVYDIKPDSITVAEGVAQPMDRADNPGYNIEASPTTSGQNDGEGGTIADFLTTCGHSHEVGGFERGNGSRDDPFNVSTALQLAHVGEHLNAFFVQTVNVNVANEESLRDNFTMIGSAQTPFTGFYEGSGFAVSGLNITSSDENVGLFAVNSGTIQNLWLVSGAISSTATRTAFIGGIVGTNLDGGAVRACSNGAAVFGTSNTFTGGIAGYNFGGARVHDCFNYGSISGVDNVGGICGVNRQSSTITGSYNAGIIEGRNSVGSVAGFNESAIITNCYYLVNTAELGIGEGGGTAIPKTSSELSSADMAMELSAGNENTIWIAGQTSNNGYKYPMHRRPDS